MRSLIFKLSEAQMSGNQVTCQQEDGKRHNRDIYKIVLRFQLQSLYVASMFLFFANFCNRLESFSSDNRIQCQEVTDF